MKSQHAIIPEVEFLLITLDFAGGSFEQRGGYGAGTERRNSLINLAFRSISNLVMK